MDRAALVCVHGVEPGPAGCGRKIDPGETYCMPSLSWETRGSASCCHDFNGPADAHDGEAGHWTCTRCGAVACVEVWD